MKKRITLFTFILGMLFIYILNIPIISFAQTVYNLQTQHGVAGNVPQTSFSVSNPIVSAVWTQVDIYGRLIHRVTLVDADSTITSVDMNCWSAQSAAGAFPAQMQVITATSATGISTTVNSTIRHTATGGGAPGSSSWTWVTTSFPGPFIRCTYTANGAITAMIDTLQVDLFVATP